MNRFRIDLPREARRLLADAEKQRKEDWKKVHGSIDHVIPACRNGANSPSNYVFACDQCNGMKAQLTLEEFRAAIETVTGQAVVFFGERSGQNHWSPPKPLVCVSMRKPMIAQMECALIERLAPFLPSNA